VQVTASDLITAKAIIFVHVPAASHGRFSIAYAMVQEWVIQFTSHSSLFKLLGNTSLNFFLALNPTSLKILILSLEALFVLSESAVHDSVEVLFDLFDVLFSPHESFHENIELLIEPYDLYTGIA